MEPNHLLAIGLGNVHKKIDNLKLVVDSNLDNSSNGINKLHGYIDEINDKIGDITELNENLAGKDIISALNYLDSNKVHVELATEISEATSNVLTFTDKDPEETVSTSHKVYTQDYIDNVIENLYKDLNNYCVNMAKCDCYKDDTLTSIIYGDSEYYCIDQNCSNVLTCYYLDNENTEHTISSYGVIFDSDNDLLSSSYSFGNSECIHVWYPTGLGITPEDYTGLNSAIIVYHPINVKKQFKINPE